MKRVATVGQLIDLLQKYDRNMQLALYVKDIEKHGYTRNIYLDKKRMELVTRKTRDAFDDEEYEYKCFVPLNRGEKEKKGQIVFDMLEISGIL